jgi:hypothetical protein
MKKIILQNFITYVLILYKRIILEIPMIKMSAK